MDAEILTKVQSNQLNKVITAFIYVYQSEFMPRRGTDINIRRLLTYVARAEANSPGVAVSLDAKKAFDSVKWNYLHKFGLRCCFIIWIRMLYLSQ